MQFEDFCLNNLWSSEAIKHLNGVLFGCKSGACLITMQWVIRSLCMMCMCTMTILYSMPVSWRAEACFSHARIRSSDERDAIEAKRSWAQRSAKQATRCYKMLQDATRCYKQEKDGKFRKPKMNISYCWSPWTAYFTTSLQLCCVHCTKTSCYSFLKSSSLVQLDGQMPACPWWPKVKLWEHCTRKKCYDPFQQRSPNLAELGASSAVVLWDTLWNSKNNSRCLSLAGRTTMSSIS